MPLTHSSQSTGFVSCLFSSATMSRGSHPGRMGWADAFIQTAHLGGFMRGSTSSRAAASLSWAGCMRAVWNAPEVFSTFACKAPCFSARSFRLWIAFSVPPTEKPPGKRQLAIWQTAPFPSSSTAVLRRGSSSVRSRPATDNISCLPTAAASCMASPRSLTSFSPSSKVMTPAAQSAVYSPRDRPAMADTCVTASLRSQRSCSTPASPATKRAGWQCLVSSSFSSGPSRQSFRRS
mmetsp:Transcript_25664/g.58345  ORF Transcript_25664/g.58345 Transcript_25664/m.58345 type:complete len:235 (-) Transcript_25664:165-869(-)